MKRIFDLRDPGAVKAFREELASGQDPRIAAARRVLNQIRRDAAKAVELALPARRRGK